MPFEGNEKILLLIPVTVLLIQDLLLILRSMQVKHYTLLDQNVTTAYILYRLYVTIKFVVVRRLRQSLACIKVIFFGHHVVCCDTHGTVTLTKMVQMPFYNTIRVNQTTEQQVFPLFYLAAVDKLDMN